MAIFHSYVQLPEGTSLRHTQGMFQFTMDRRTSPHLVSIHRLKDIAQHLAIKVRLRTEQQLKLLRKMRSLRRAIDMEREETAFAEICCDML